MSSARIWVSARFSRYPRKTARLLTLMTVSAIATSASRADTSLMRSETWSGSSRRGSQNRRKREDMARPLRRGQPEHVSDAAQGVDQPRPAAVHLASQHGHVGLDDPGVAAEVVVPHMVEDLHLGKHPVGVAHEVAQQLEFRGGQLDRPPGPPYLVAVLVELEVGELQPGRGLGGIAPGAAQHGPDAGDDLLE